MVNEPRINVNSKFFTTDFQDLYDSMCADVFMHRAKVYMPCCGQDESIDSFILYGTFPRDVIDARITGYDANGIPEFEVVKYDGFAVQRVQHKSCDHTHSLMFELFIPYQRYSNRYVLIHLSRYFLLGQTVEDYCLDNDIDIRTFRRWLDWLEKAMPFLTEQGIVQDKTENRANLKSWFTKIWDGHFFWQLLSLARLNLALFQRHNMPAGYLNYNLRSCREILSPT